MLQNLSTEFTPKLITRLREGYSWDDLRADALAGLTVAIVALPLSMAIAIASGVGPERGLYTAIVGGFLVSMLGGSRYQIGGPAGAFIVLVSACVMQVGLDGLILATLISGVFLTLLGLMRAGTMVRFIPYPVTLGFTAGIAVIIFVSQIKDLGGMQLPHDAPEVLEKLAALWGARQSVSGAALGLALGSIGAIYALRIYAPRAPSLLIVVAGASALAVLAGLPVETIYDRFGDLPRLPPAPALPDLSLPLVWAALPWALSFTLLGAIESLLSAVVADGMSGRRHRPNAELIAQGVANIGSAMFGGFCVTGTIARTATNVRAGARGPVAGMLHALFVLVFLLIAAPLAGYIPLAALAAVLAVVAWNMAEKAEIWHLMRTSRADTVVMLVTFLLVVFRDLSEGIVVGFALGGLLFIHRMSEAATQSATHPAETDPALGDLAVIRLHGPYFFGAAARIGGVMDQMAEHPLGLAIDFSDVPFIDSTGAHSVVLLAEKMARKGHQLYLTGLRGDVENELRRAGLTNSAQNSPHRPKILPQLQDLAAQMQGNRA
jgi:SulP family sulfate permease